MKTKLMLLAICLWIVSQASNHAATVIDNFDDNSKDPSKWGADTGPSNALSEESGVLLYQHNSALAGTAARPWLRSKLPYDSDWIVEIDTSNSCVAASSGDACVFGLLIVNDANPSDQLEFANFFGPVAGQHGFSTAMRTDGFTDGSTIHTNYGNAASIRIQFNSNSKYFRLFLGTGPGFPTNNYTYVNLGTYGVAGQSGSNGENNWGLTSNSTFSVAVFASSTGGVSSIVALGDNFRITGAIETFQCALSPATATNTVDSIHSVTATVTSNAVPLTGVTVGFLITNGPGLGTSASDVTDGNGEAVFVYTNNGTAGTDTILATGIVNSVEFSTTASKFWSSGNADLAVTKTDSPDPVFRGQNVTYTIIVTNKGPNTAQNVSLLDTLSLDVNFISSSIGGLDGHDNDGHDLVACDLGSLAPGASSNVTIVVKVADYVDGVTNVVDVTSDSLDPVPANNNTTAATAVLPPPPEFTAEIAATNGMCTVTTKTTDCPVDGTLTLLNNGGTYLAGDFSLVSSSKLAPKVGCKFFGTLTPTSTSPEAVPKHYLGFYLSDDATLDAGDPLLQQLEVTKVIQAIFKNKTVKLKFKLAKGTCTTGKFLIIKADATNLITENEENDNTASYGPLP